MEAAHAVGEAGEAGDDFLHLAGGVLGQRGDADGGELDQSDRAFDDDRDAVHPRREVGRAEGDGVAVGGDVDGVAGVAQELESGAEVVVAGLGEDADGHARLHAAHAVVGLLLLLRGLCFRLWLRCGVGDGLLLLFRLGLRGARGRCGTGCGG